MSLDRDNYMQLAQLMREFAEFLEAKAARLESTPSEAKKPKPTKKAAATRKRRRVVPPPPSDVTDVDVALAKRLARKAGILVR